MLSGDPIPQIKERLLLSDVVGGRVKLKRSGKTWIGLCPFHSEKTPSFHVDDQKGFYHCFGCGASGDILNFVMQTEHVPFGEALRMLASRAGVELRERKPTTSHVGEKKLLQEVARYFERQLWAHAEVLSYLRERGIEEDTIRGFHLGYAPPSRRFREDLGCRQKELEALGLSREGKPLFWERLMFPIFFRTQVVGFGGRSMRDDAVAKYLNSRDSDLFTKSEQLYAFPDLRPGEEELVLVEGYVDVLAMSQAGYRAASPMGTAVTLPQLQRALRYGPNLTLCLDGDAAGRRATKRALALLFELLTPERKLRIILLPEGYDPDSFITTFGAESFASLQRRDPLSVLLSWERPDDLSTPESHALYEENLERYVGAIAHPLLRKHYARHIRDVLFRLRRETPQAATFDRPVSSPSRTEWMILAIYLRFPELMTSIPDFLEIPMKNPATERIRHLLQKYVILGLPLERTSLASYMKESRVSFRGKELSPDVSVEAARSFLEDQKEIVVYRRGGV